MLASTFGIATAKTMSSCGSDTDHFKIKTITTDADATGGLKKGEPFTISAEGEFDGLFQEGTVNGIFAINALSGVVKQNVHFSQRFGYYPGLPQGTNKLTIGPFTFPRSIPGKVDVVGNITIVDTNQEQVTCIAMDMHIPTIVDEGHSQDLEVGRHACGDPTTDHIQDIVVTTDANNITTSTMTLDEDLPFLDLTVDFTFKVPLLPAATLKLTSIPVSIEPAVPAGPLKFVGYPCVGCPYSSSDDSNAVLHTEGKLTFSDKAGDEITCMAFGNANKIVV